MNNDTVVVAAECSLYLWGDEIIVNDDYGGTSSSNYVYQGYNNEDTHRAREGKNDGHVNDEVIDDTNESKSSSSSSSPSSSRQRELSKLATCLKEYTNSSTDQPTNSNQITMLHLRDIHTIDRDDDIVAITQFLLSNPTCNKVWIEDCDMKKMKQKTKCTTSLPTKKDEEETTTTTTSLAPLLSAILSLRRQPQRSSSSSPTAASTSSSTSISRDCCCCCCSYCKDSSNGDSGVDDPGGYGCSCSNNSIVKELILEGPNLSNDCLNAILNSFRYRCCPCCATRGGGGGLKRLTINKWQQDRTLNDAEETALAIASARIMRNNNGGGMNNNFQNDDDEEEDNIDNISNGHDDSFSSDNDADSWSLSQQSHISTSFPYQLMKVLSSSSVVATQQQPFSSSTTSSSTMTSCDELTHVTIRGLKIVRLDRGDDEMRLLPPGNEEDHEEGSKRNHQDLMKTMISTMTRCCNGATTKIKHWDISECLFEDIFRDDDNLVNVVNRNDPTFLVRWIKLYCPLLESLRMDSNDICCMMNNDHPRRMESGDSFDNNTDSMISSQVTPPSDLFSGEVQRYECPILTDILAMPTFRTLELCWESVTPPEITAGLRERLNQQFGAGQIYYDGMVNCEESLLGRFFLSREFATAMVRSWNSMESEWELEGSDSLLLRRLAKGIGASLELSYYNRMRRSSRSDDGDVIAVDGIMKLDLSRNSWSMQDLRHIFLISARACALQPSLSTLQELSLCCCDINGTRFLYLICNVLYQMKMLRSLCIGYNPIFEFDNVNDEINVEFLKRTRYIYYGLLEFVRFHPRLTFLSLEGVDGIPRVIREELLYILSIKRCGSHPPPSIFFKGSLEQRTTELDGKVVAPLPSANALWPLILDHSRFANFNDMSILRTDIDSIRAQSQAIYYLLRGGPLINEVVPRVR